MAGTATRRWVGSAAAACALAVLAGCAVRGSAPVAPPAHAPAVYPYVEVDSEGPQDFTRVRRDAGVAGLILAFVIDGGGCRPVWSRGRHAATDAEVRARVDALARGGLRPRISFGGADGTDLAAGCRDIGGLTAAYRAVVDTYHPGVVDLDVEGRVLGDRAATERLIRAVHSTQQAAAAAGRPFDVSYTLPAGAEGITADGLDLLTRSVAGGVHVTTVNVLAMDYGTGVRDLGGEATRQAGLARAAVRRLWPELSGEQAWRRVGVTVMIGRNDVPGEVFGPADARRLARLAADRGLGWLSYWSVERDRSCTAPTAPAATWNCSGIRQQPFEFARILTTPAS